jgi:lipopolysaccharide/colanic/teichoic acid biosynthesis glycosyltransferase
MKRWLDIILTIQVLPLSLPIMALVSLLIYLEDGRPIFYRQQRIGRNQRRYYLLKFRSMRINDLSPAELGQVRANHHLVTNIGRIIRRTKIDELPQLLNVLLGQMSIVGPRPTIAEQVECYNGFERRRLLVRPGLTGWAQVHGNTELSWAERIALDVWYVDHWSLWLDIKVLLKTVGVIVHGEVPDEGALREAIAHADRTDRCC